MSDREPSENDTSNVSLIVSDISENIIQDDNESLSEATIHPEASESVNKPDPLEKPISLVKTYGNYQGTNDSNSSKIKWFEQTEYIIFRNELKAVQRNNKVVLKECKENKRLLDLKYDDLTSIVNNIQTSVIFFSTISGFLQATRIQFNIPDTTISIFSISISTYISLLLSISKYYKLDELKERIQTLREKYSLLQNKLDYRMDVLGPWMVKNIWIHQDPKKKLLEWAKVNNELTKEYDIIIDTKQKLVTECEIIMDTKSRNQYHIKNRELNYNNRRVLYAWDKKEAELEQQLRNTPRRPSSIVLQHEELDNWEDDDDDDIDF